MTRGAGRRRSQVQPKLVIEMITVHTATVRGLWCHAAIKQAGVPCQFDYRPPGGGDPCWTVPASRVADVVAAAEHMRGHADVRSTLWSDE